MSELKCGPITARTEVEPTALGIWIWRVSPPFGAPWEGWDEGLTQEQAQAAADAALAFLRAQMLCDLLGGPEWVGLASGIIRLIGTLERLATAPVDRAALMGGHAALVRKLAAALEKPEVTK